MRFVFFDYDGGSRMKSLFDIDTKLIGQSEKTKKHVSSTTLKHSLVIRHKNSFSPSRLYTGDAETSQ